MPEMTLTIRNQVGLHARPAALFVQTARRFACTVDVAHGERHANAKSILAVLALGAGQGATITLRAEGPDADQALDSLRALVESNFGEGA